MARKILIIFALIIAIFPYLGFSDFADNIVTTVMALLIALALLFSRKPKLAQQKDNYEPRVDMPSPFSVQMHDIHIAHKEDESSYPTINNGENIINLHKVEEAPSEIVSPVVKLPRKRVVTPIATNEVKVEEVSINNNIIDRPFPPQRRIRKNTERVMLSQEESVQPADVPARFE